MTDSDASALPLLDAWQSEKTERHTRTWMHVTKLLDSSSGSGGNEMENM